MKKEKNELIEELFNNMSIGGGCLLKSGIEDRIKEVLHDFSIDDIESLIYDAKLQIMYVLDAKKTYATVELPKYWSEIPKNSYLLVLCNLEYETVAKQKREIKKTIKNILSQLVDDSKMNKDESLDEMFKKLNEMQTVVDDIKMLHSNLRMVK